MTLVWQIPEQARDKFRSGKAGEALQITNAILADDPNSADTLLTRATILMSAGNIKDAIADLKSASDLRSPEWVFERLHSQFLSRTTVNLSTEHALKLGAFMRQRLSALGPVLPPARRRADHGYINVVGASLVRSFGGHTCFLPIFVGMGPGMLLLTDDTARISIHKLIENLKRIDLTRPTIITIAADGYYHLENILKLRKSAAAPLDEADFAVMEQVAERHRTLLVAARKLVTGRLMLLGITPAPDDRLNVLSHHLNKHLSRVCGEVGVDFLDWWTDLADPVTDRLASQYCANAYPGDIHFSLETTPVFLDKLKAIGVLDPALESKRNYEWSHVFEYDVGVGEKTRIWSEPSVSPNNATKSHKIAASHVYGRVADLLTTTFLASGPASAIYVNVRDGYLPTILPASLVSRSVALTASPLDAGMARAVLDVCGRTDSLVREQTPGVLNEIAGFEPSILIGATFPDTQSADLDAINAALAAVAGPSVAAILTIDPAEIGRVSLAGYQLWARVLIGHRFLPEAWQKATVFIVRKRPRI